MIRDGTFYVKDPRDALHPTTMIRDGTLYLKDTPNRDKKNI